MLHFVMLEQKATPAKNFWRISEWWKGTK